MVWTKPPPKPKTSQFILYIDLVSSKFNLKFSNLAELVYLVLKGVFCIFFFFLGVDSLGFSIYKIMSPINIVLHCLFLSSCFLQAYLILLGFALLHCEDNYIFF